MIGLMRVERRGIMRVFCLLMSLAFFPAILHASDFQNDQIADLEFRSLRFGQGPDAEMICTKGPCYSGRPGENIKKKRKPPFSTYKFPMDVTHLGQTEITAPKYDFYLNRFFQVSFGILCDPEQAEFCMEAVRSALDERYGLTLVKTIHRDESTLDPGISRTHLTASGALVEISRNMRRGEWLPPFVKIYDQTLMDELRLSVNPDYIANPFR
jgi:hypothetical protein